MTGNEIMVSLVFLILGYGIVSFFFLERKPQSKPQTWPRVLNLAPDASAEEIRAAYQVLIDQYHPDKVASLGAELREVAQRKSEEITAAYQEAMRARS
jgi:DnaJ like chaperone protein